MDFRSRLCPQAAWLQFIYMRCCNDKSANSAVDYQAGTEHTHPMRAHAHSESWRIGFGDDNHAATHAKTFVLLWRRPPRDGISCSALTDISEVSRWGQRTRWKKNKCGRRSKISSSWFQRDKTLWCTLDSGLLLVLVMRRMFESWSLQVLSSLFFTNYQPKNPWICSEPCFILDPQRLPCFSKCVEVWSHFARSGLQLLGLSKKKSLKEQEERKQEDGFRKRGQVQLKNVLSPREVELVNKVQGRCLVPTMCWIYQRLFWPVFQGRWWTPQYSRSSLRSMDQLSLVSVLPTAVSQSLCSPLCSVMFFTNGCTARICAILSVKSQTVGLRKQYIYGVSNAHAFYIFNCKILHSQKPSQ